MVERAGTRRADRGGACGLLLATTTGAVAAERAYELVSPPRKGMGGLVLGLQLTMAMRLRTT